MDNNKLIDIKHALASKVPLANIQGVEEFIYDIDKEVERIVSGKGQNAFSYWHSSHMLISLIEDAKENDGDPLRLEAILCDVFNGFAHAVQEAYGERTPIVKSLFALKDIMINRIEYVCKQEGNKSYGYAKDEFGKKVFVVDIPETGQIVWHYPRYYPEEPQYPYSVVKKSIDQTNKDFLSRRYENLTQAQINQQFDPHTALILQSYDMEDMNNKLEHHYNKSLGQNGRNNTFLGGLQELVEQPSAEELKLKPKKKYEAPAITILGDDG